MPLVYRAEGQIESNFYRAVMFPESLTFPPSDTECAHLMRCHLVHMGIPGGKLENHIVIMWEISKAVWPPGLKQILGDLEGGVYFPN